MSPHHSAPKFAPYLGLGVLVYLTACGAEVANGDKIPGETQDSGEDSAQPEPVQTLCSGEVCLDVDPAQAMLRLWVGGAHRLDLPIASFNAGVEAAFEDNRSYDPSYPDPDTQIRSAERIEITALSEEAIEATLSLAGGGSLGLLIEPAGPGRFSLQLRPGAELDGSTDGQVAVSLAIGAELGENEGLYGLGEWFEGPEHRGKVRPMHLLADFEMESSYNEAHVPVPFLIGTQGWGLLIADDHPTVFDLGATDPNRLAVTVGLGAATPEGLRFELYGATEAADVTAHYWARTGAPQLPAPWALGPLIWRDENIDQAEVEADILQIRTLDLPASGIWIDRPYASGVNTFDFDPSLYADPRAMVDFANAQGLRVGVWHTPYVNDEQSPTLHAEATENGYFPPDVPVVFNSWGEPIDFSNPEAYAWWQDQIGSYTDLGIEGYKLDYGEDVVLGLNGGRVVWGFADGSDERTKHKDYSRLYHRVYGETLGEDGGFLLCRAGTWGGQVNASIIWPGDLDADLSQHRDLREDGTLAVGGLPAAVSAAIGLGPSGYPFFGSDTGGYRHSPPDRETFIRWFQHSALSAVMQVGNSASVQPWELLEEADLALYRDFSRLHLRLFPYLWSLAKNIESGGRPILLPFGLAQPEHGSHPADQYFIGPELMVAPVIESGAITRTFTCPTGSWLNWFDGTPLSCTSGSPITVDAPLESLPLYLRAGGIVPLLRPDIDTLAPVENPADIASFASEPGRLWARVALGAMGTSQLYDGSELVLEDDGSTATLTFRSGDVFVSGMGLELVGLGGSPTGVQVDGSDSEDWSWEAGILRVPAASSTVRIQR